MALVYSTKLGAGATAGAGTVAIFTAAAGFVTVVRDISLLLVAPCTQALVFVTGAGTLFGAINPGAATEYAHQEGRWVLAPGDVVELFTAGGGCQWHVSGYLLTP